MERNKLYHVAIALFIIVAATLALIFLLKPKTQEKIILEKNELPQPSMPLSPIINQHQQPPSEFITGLEHLPASLNGTEVDGELTVDADGNLIVTKRVRDMFDYFLGTIGEENLATITKRIDAYIKKHLPEKAATQASDLFHRYLAYRDALAQKVPNTGGVAPEKADINLIRKQKDLAKQLRQQFFSTKENQAFFGAEDTFDYYNLAMLELTNNKQLSTAQKAEQMNSLFQKLPEQIQANMRPVMLYQQLTSLTEELKAHGGSKEELHSLRVKIVGAEATSRLESLDTSRVVWQARIDNYLVDRQNILNQTNLSEPQKEAMINALRQKQFNSQEQLRLPAFEQMAAQGITSDQL